MIDRIVVTEEIKRRATYVLVAANAGLSEKEIAMFYCGVTAEIAESSSADEVSNMILKWMCETRQ